MLPDERDTIAAIATAAGGAARGVVRVAGPAALEVVAACLPREAGMHLVAHSQPVVLAGQALSIELAGESRALPADLYVWPDQRSYVRQPTIEAHVPGSPPLCDAVLRAFCSNGARLAAPGEFTLRAVLNGRLDLTQAEAVLGVIDARGEADLQVALEQLAGGLTAPLGRVREDLIGLLADLEAGLDFVEEEDVQFVTPAEVTERVTAAMRQVDLALGQASSRSLSAECPTVVLSGPPNAGKSTLFNCLCERAGVDRPSQGALVSSTPGSTRDRLRAAIEHHGVRFELVDTAGHAAITDAASLDAAMQAARTTAVGSATLVVECQPVDGPGATGPQPPGVQQLQVLTKADLASDGLPGLAVSAATGLGIELLLNAIAERLDANLAQAGAAMVPSTAARCAESLAGAKESLRRGLELVEQGDELVALELRTALDDLGRVLGDVVTDDILDRIFSRFCIGK